MVIYIIHKFRILAPKCRTAHLAKLNRRPLNLDQADKALRSFIINDKHLGKSGGSIRKITSRSLA